MWSDRSGILYSSSGLRLRGYLFWWMRRLCTSCSADQSWARSQDTRMSVRCYRLPSWHQRAPRCCECCCRSYSSSTPPPAPLRPRPPSTLRLQRVGRPLNDYDSRNNMRLLKASRDTHLCWKTGSNHIGAKKARQKAASSDRTRLWRRHSARARPRQPHLHLVRRPSEQRCGA